MLLNIKLAYFWISTATVVASLGFLFTEVDFLPFAFVAVCALLWYKTRPLKQGDTINPDRLHLGLLFTTMAMLAFPGTLFIPVMMARWLNDSSIGMYAWLSLPGIFFAGPLLLIGVALVLSAGPRKTGTRESPAQNGKHAAGAENGLN